MFWFLEFFIILKLATTQQVDLESLQEMGFEEMADFYSRPDGVTNTSYITAMCPHVSSERYSPNYIQFSDPLKTYLHFRLEYFSRGRKFTLSLGSLRSFPFILQSVKIRVQ